jgi:gas vesicle protein
MDYEGDLVEVFFAAAFFLATFFLVAAFFGAAAFLAAFFLATFFFGAALAAAVTFFLATDISSKKTRNMLSQTQSIRSSRHDELNSTTIQKSPSQQNSRSGFLTCHSVTRSTVCAKDHLSCKYLYKTRNLMQHLFDNFSTNMKRFFHMPSSFFEHEITQWQRCS